MQARINYQQLAPKHLQALLGLSGAVHNGSLDKRLLEIINLRVSQINGCAFCIDMHWHALLKMDMQPRHVNAVAGWREAPFFSEKERAALGWAEAVNTMGSSGVSDEEFAKLKAQFSDKEIAELGFAIATIKTWNLLNVGFQTPLPEKPYEV